MHELTSTDASAFLTIIKRSLLQNFILIKCASKLFLIHKCMVNSQYKCQCTFKAQLKLATKIKNRQNGNKLVSTCPLVLMLNILFFVEQNRNVKLLFFCLNGKRIKTSVPVLIERLEKKKVCKVIYNGMVHIINDDTVSPSEIQTSVHNLEQYCKVDDFSNGEMPQSIVEYIINQKLDAISILIRNLCWKFQPQPPETILDVPEIFEVNSGLEFLEGDKLVETGIRMYRREVTTRCRNLVEFLEASAKANATPAYILTEKYMSVHASFDILKKIINFQFPSLGDRIKFVSDLFGFINEDINKKKIFALVGPPNSGKTSIAVVTCLLRGPYGTAKGLQKGNDKTTFPFEQLTGNASLFVDEADVGPNFFSALKDLSGGNGGSFNPQKGVKSVWTKPIPIFFTSNDELLAMEEEVWQTRAYYYRFRSIKPSDKIWSSETHEAKIHPMALKKLFQQYKLLK